MSSPSYAKPTSGEANCIGALRLPLSGLSERGTNLADKTRVLIVAEAWLDLAERTMPLVERESGEAHRIIEQPFPAGASGLRFRALRIVF